MRTNASSLCKTTLFSVSKCTVQCEQMHRDDFLLVTLAAGFHSLNLISS